MECISAVLFDSKTEMIYKRNKMNVFFWRMKLKDGSSNLKIFFITGKEGNLFNKSTYINSEYFNAQFKWFSWLDYYYS